MRREVQSLSAAIEARQEQDETEGQVASHWRKSEGWPGCWQPAWDAPALFALRVLACVRIIQRWLAIGRRGLNAAELAIVTVSDMKKACMSDH